MLRYSWSAPIRRSCLPSDRLDFTSLIFTKVSCTEECSRPSASCILFCAAPSLGPVEQDHQRQSQRAAHQHQKLTKCQSMAIRIPAAPTKLTTIPIKLGRILIMPFLITFISENTRFTSSPLGVPFSPRTPWTKSHDQHLLQRILAQFAELWILSQLRTFDKRCCMRMIPTSISAYFTSSSEFDDTAPSTSPFVASVKNSENTVASTVIRHTITTLTCTHFDHLSTAAHPGTS